MKELARTVRTTTATTHRVLTSVPHANLSLLQSQVNVKVGVGCGMGVGRVCDIRVGSGLEFLRLGGGNDGVLIGPSAPFCGARSENSPPFQRRVSKVDPFESRLICDT